MRCEHVLPLVSRYVDDELAPAQAGPFRKHLLECQSCRVRVQESEALRSWFVDPKALVGPAQAPAGFAAKVTAMAFESGTEQLRTTQLRPAPPRLVSGPDFADPSTATPNADSLRRQGHEQELSRFVLNLVGAAAIVLLMFSFGIKRSSLPTVGELHADNASMTQSLDSLDALNEQEAQQSPGEANASPSAETGPSER